MKGMFTKHNSIINTFLKYNLQTCKMTITNKSGQNRSKIIIIGAGVAGLAAANNLLKNGINDFKILEAKDTIGGRIASSTIGRNKIELGANWIHGNQDNPIYDLAVANGLVITERKPSNVIFRTEDGKYIPSETVQEIHQVYKSFLQNCEKYHCHKNLRPPGIRSVGDHLKEESDQYLIKTNKCGVKQIFDCLLKREACVHGCDSVNEIDLLGFGSFKVLQGGNIEIPSGFSTLLIPLSKNIPIENIFLQHQVSHIRWKLADSTFTSNDSINEYLSSKCLNDIKCDDVHNYSHKRLKVKFDEDSNNYCTNFPNRTQLQQSISPRVHIECENGTYFYAEHVICTIPLGVLKTKASSLFRPNLPRYKVNAIQKLNFGTVEKIFLEYDKPILNENESEIMLLWEPEKNDENIKNIWYRKIYSFSKISETVLMGWISGKEAEYMETLPNNEVLEECGNILRKFLNNYSIPNPKRCTYSTWRRDPYTMGSYTAIAVGATNDDISRICLPLYSNLRDMKPTLLFAGEHAHKTFYSTVHGAYISGIVASEALLH